MVDLGIGTERIRYIETDVQTDGGEIEMLVSSSPPDTVDMGTGVSQLAYTN